MSITARTRIALAVAIVGLGTMVGAGVAGAQSTDPYVSPSSVVKPEVLSETVTKSAAAPAVESSLAFTGGDAAGLALIGGVAVAAGAAITVSRRRTAAA